MAICFHLVIFCSYHCLSEIVRLIFSFPLILQHVFSEPFEPSPFFPTKGLDDEYDPSSKQQGRVDGNIRPLDNEKEINTRETNVAKIKVVVCLEIWECFL